MVLQCGRNKNQAAQKLNYYNLDIIETALTKTSAATICG